ncbi:MAG: prepilin peptidase [Candidatus Brennerbacteria bacterium]|nr:prepilin peptidase [Candidatus Brennerbacteria bacterium]
MSIIFYASLFLFGLAAGSFLNALTLRYSPERNFFSCISLGLSPDRAGRRSHCMQCRARLRWYELIPLVSFMLQRGRCRSCGARLSWQYPAIELAAAALAVGIPIFFSAWYGSAGWWSGIATFEAPGWYYGFLFLWYLAALAWLAIVVIDIRHYLVPDELNVALLALGVGIVALLAAYGGALPPFRASFLKHYALLFSPSFLQGTLAMHLAGAVAGGMFFWFLSLLARGNAMGLGDVKLALASGFILGFPDIALAAMFAFIAGGAGGGFLMATGRKKIGDKLPFAPFLVLGFVATITLGFPILSWYFELLNF